LELTVAVEKDLKDKGDKMYSFDNITKKQAKEFVDKILFDMTVSELDKLFSKHISEYVSPFREFKLTREAVNVKS